MVSWQFWTIFGLTGYTLISATVLLVHNDIIRYKWNLWLGGKDLVIWKKGNHIKRFQFIKNEPTFGIKWKDRTYTTDEKKGLRMRRTNVHVFEVDNIAELDFSDKNGTYAPHKFDPVVYQKAIRRALASGVNEAWKQWLIIGIIIMIVISVGAIASAYFGYQNFELMRDYLVDKGVMKL